MNTNLTRRNFIGSAGACTVLMGNINAQVDNNNDAIALWQKETSQVTARIYRDYLRNGDTRNLQSLVKLEQSAAKILKEVQETAVGDIPAVWSLYNMGYVVKTKQTLFTIDLVHRRAKEFAPISDFALISHFHGDHYHSEYYKEMNKARKTVISNFLDNYEAFNWDTMEGGGYVRGAKTFRIKDVEITTSLVDHNQYLVDFTTAFEIRVGDWIMYHTGDCGRGSEPKLSITGSRRPDLWLFFPGCGINVAKAVEKVRPKKLVFGHLWELGHDGGRLTEPLIRPALEQASKFCDDVSVAFWGERIV